MARRSTFAAFVAAGLGAALLLALLISPFASSSPDGLEKVAADEGLDSEVEPHALEDWPLADYGVEGVEDERLGTGLSGVIGVVLTFVIAAALFALVRWLRPERSSRSDQPVHADGDGGRAAQVSSTSSPSDIDGAPPPG
jgi:hypothetical protein